MPIGPEERIADWSFVADSDEVIAVSVSPAPGILDRPVSLGGSQIVPPDPAYYESSTVFPRERIQFSGIQSGRGSAHGTFLISPFTGDPVSRELTYSASGQLTYSVESGATGNLGPSLRVSEASQTAARGTGRIKSPVPRCSCGSYPPPGHSSSPFANGPWEACLPRPHAWNPDRGRLHN